MNDPKRPDYGIDAPNVLRRFSLIGAIGVIAGPILIKPLRLVIHPAIAIGLGMTLFWIGCSFLLTTAVMLWGSKFGKLRFVSKIINTIDWVGNETVLDVGCGHGLMLITAAKRLTTGKAIGVDLWQREDQAGNSPEATLANVRIEKVADRVEIRNGDARQLPLDNSSIDVVVSSWALHNIYDQTERDRALREIVRVLKPGGKVALVDIRHTNEYAQVFRDAGLEDVQVHGPNFLFLIPSYWLTAAKPAAV